MLESENVVPTKLKSLHVKLIPLNLANFFCQLLYNHKKVSRAVEHSITMVNSLNISNRTKSLKLYQQKFGNVIY